MHRWYDKHKNLARHLEKFKGMETRRRNRIVRDVLKIVREMNPGILEEFLLDFPLDVIRRRWYDEDPYLWLLFNGLEHADQPLLERITNHLRTTMKKAS